MKRAFVVLLLLVGSVPVAEAARRRAVAHPSRSVAPAAIVNAAKQAAQAAMGAGIPAVQIAVSRRGEVLYSAAFGLADRESTTAATPQTVMQTGSITKQFTAAGILRLAERGALSLDDSITKYVPEYNPPGATITLRHLLTHTSGVNGLPPDEYALLTRAKFITLVHGQPLLFTPGSKWSYSNSGYRLLGYAIESISGMSFADFVHKEFAVPLGLLYTGVCGTSNLPKPDGYALMQGTWLRVPAIEMSVPFSAGAICSTASDLTRWAQFLATGRVLQPASYAAMTTAAQLADGTFAPYGFGLFLQKQLGRTTVWHTGGIPGFNSSLLYFPEEEIAVAVIVNALPLPPGVAAHVLATEVAKAALASSSSNLQSSLAVRE